MCKFCIEMKETIIGQEYFADRTALRYRHTILEQRGYIMVLETNVVNDEIV